MITKLLSKDQLTKIWTAAKEKGFDKESVHAMLPSGKLSTKHLTVIEASVLIDAIDRGKSPDYSRVPRIPADRRPKRRPKNVYAFATTAQRNTIEAIRIDLDWSPVFLAEWLARRHFSDGRPMNQIQSSGDAVAVIELMKAVRIRQTRADAKRKETL